MNSQVTGANAFRTQREHYWDAVRAFLMLLGIPYHTALSYRPAGQEWIVRSGGGASVFSHLADFLHLFRMPAFFVIAGYFAALLLARRSPDEWLRGRLLRVGVPLLACIMTLVPVMNLACELSDLPLRAALSSWRHNSLTSPGYWIRHLWFLVVLLYCSTAAAVLVARYPALRSAELPSWLDGWLANRFLLALTAIAAIVGLWEAAAIELFYKAGMATKLFQEFLRIDDLIAGAPFFLLGCLLCRSPQVRRRLLAFSPTVAVLALGLTIVSLSFVGVFPPWLGRFVGTLAAVAITQVILSTAKRIVDRPNPVVQELVAASFVIYLVHMPIVVVLVALMASLSLPVVGKALGVMLLSFVLSYGAWRVISRSPLLCFAFDGRLPPKAQELLV